jgi:hypothetical protein
MRKVIVLALMLSNSIFANTNVAHTDSAPLISFAKSSKKSLTTNDNYNLTLKNEAFGHLFLMHTSIIDNPPAATGNPLAAKVIYFKRNANFVAMFESTAGKLVTDSVTTKILLAKFPVVFKTANDVTFNFEEGMKILFQKSSYYIANPKVDPNSESTYEILESYINKVELRKNHIFIDQFLRVLAPATSRSAAEVSPVQIKYTFSSYKKNENFKPTVSPGFTNVGYFENYPVYPIDEEGNIVEEQVVHIKKFDTSKEITFHITDNVPAKYKQAVTDGVKYWNKAFKRELIKVSTLPNEVSIHEPGYNIVQWLNWDTAGFAYAASNSDPLTGQINQAHVFMTSSFATNSYRGIKTTLNRLLTEDKKDKESHMALEGFKSSRLCGSYEQRRDAEISRLKEIEESLESSDYSEEEKEIMYVRYVSDYIREVVAHEIGHTLGFRHNFAASLETNVNSKNYNAIGKKYLLTGEISPEIKVGSSVMDYTPGYFSSFIGAKIRLEDSALDYDQHVVDVAYNEASSASERIFCTDDHAEKFYDCFRFDAFKNVIDEKQFFMEESLKRLGHTLIGKKFAFLADDELSRDSKLTQVKYMYNTAEYDVSWYAKNRFKVLATKAKKGQISIVTKRSVSNNPEVSSEVENFFNENIKKVKKDFDEVGGISKLLIQNITPTFDGKLWLSPLSRIVLESSNSLFNKYYPNFEDAELKEEVMKKVTEYVVAFDRKFVFMAIQYIDQNYSYEDKAFTESLYALSTTILDTKSDSKIFEDLEIHSPLFDFKTNGKSLRKEAVDLLKSKYFTESHSFQRKMKKLRTKAYQSFKGFEDTIITNFGDIDSTPDDIYDYYMNEKNLYKFLK